MSETVKQEPISKFYTVCFEGDPRTAAGNLFQVVSPFGTVVAIGIGNEFEESDRLRDELAKAGAQ